MIGREVEIQKTDSEVINDNTGTIKDFSYGIVGKLRYIQCQNYVVDYSNLQFV